MTQGTTPETMYITWATGNAVYTYCSQADMATNGNATDACEFNQTPPTKTASLVKYGTDAALSTTTPPLLPATTRPRCVAVHRRVANQLRPPHCPA